VLLAGLDPSLTQTGVAFGDTTRVFKSKPAEGYLDTLERLLVLSTDVCTALQGVDVVAMEGPALHSAQGQAHTRAGYWWLLYDRLIRQGSLVVVVPPGSLKLYATGKGSADKDAVLAEAIRRLHFPGKTNDEADAWVMLAMLRDHFDGVALVPESHRKALVKIEWP
jgi:Holliday junction resolvasome RuvABC endonuclease subunit